MSDASSTPTTDTNSELALPIAAIVCITVGSYVLLLIIILVIRYVLMNRGHCQSCQCSCVKPETEPCCGCCTSLSENCTCKMPSVSAYLDSVCPKRRNVDCMKIILCQCCSDGTGGSDGICNCEFGIVDCLCCKIDFRRPGRQGSIKDEESSHLPAPGRRNYNNDQMVLSAHRHSAKNRTHHNYSNNAFLHDAENLDVAALSARSLPAHLSNQTYPEQEHFILDMPLSARSLPAWTTQTSNLAQTGRPLPQTQWIQSSDSLPERNESKTVSSSRNSARRPQGARMAPPAKLNSRKTMPATLSPRSDVREPAARGMTAASLPAPLSSREYRESE